MSDSSIPVKITITDPQLDEEKLQEFVQNLRLELEELEGVEAANLVGVGEAPPGAKSVGGFILGQLEALVKPAKLKGLLEAMGHRLFGQSLEIEAEKTKDGKRLKLKVSRPEDLAAVMPEVERFINS